MTDEYRNVLVCGGRGYARADKVDAALSQELTIALAANQRLRIATGAATGADRLAIRFAELCDIEHVEFHADWSHHGVAAGPIRNGRMLREFQPVRVLAFPGGRGTADMVQRALAAGVEVVCVDSSSV